MNREILFRGKRDDNGEWVYGYFVADALEQIGRDCPMGWIRYYNDDTEKVEICDIDRKTLGEYTGFKDKNGTKIFEGDIIAHGVSAKSVIEYGWAKFICHRLFKDGREFKSIDEYNEQEFMDLCNVYECEVIGNIYDNSKLLEI